MQVLVYNHKKHSFSHDIHVGSGELYYIWILLTFQKGCKEFDCIKTVDGKLYSSFQDACYALGLLSDDKEFIDGIFEASRSQSGQMLRVLFVRLLIMSTMHKPDNVWKATWKLLADEILYARRRILNIPGIFTIFQLSPTFYVLHSRSYHLC